MTAGPTILRASRGGFAGILAITLLILVSATLAVVASAFSADARRTRAAAADAQLRQLLTAGGLAASAKLRSRDIQTTRQTIPLPRDLAGNSATLTVATSVADGIATVQVEAELGSARAGQVLRFSQRDGVWSVMLAELQ